MKRLTDLLLILITLPFWFPLFLATALVVLVCLGRPIFFREERAGYRGVPFRILKFLTMKDSHDEAGALLPDAARLTRCGRFLRSVSLDELPELFNVLLGQMTLVGPRPLPVRYVPRYSRQQVRRLEVMPGITGWAQVNGRNQLDWDDRFEHDIWYVENRGLLVDLKILGLTLTTVVRREGITADHVATMPEFMGEESAQGSEHLPD